MAATPTSASSAKATLADVSHALRSLASADAPGIIIRPGIADGLRVLARAISAAAPVNRRRVRSANRRFSRRVSKMPLHLAASAEGPNVTGRLRKSTGQKTRIGRNKVEGKVGLNVGKRKMSKSRAPHAHLVTLGTGIRRHKSGKVVGRMRPNAFVRRAAAGASSSAIQAARTRILSEIDKQLRKGNVFRRGVSRAINLVYSL